MSKTGTTFAAPAGFDIYVDPETDERIVVRFVSQRVLDRLADNEGHAAGGDYGKRVIRLTRYETRRGHRAMLFHEIGHYLVERSEWRVGRKSMLAGVSEEDVCDLLTWLPNILTDPRNEPLRRLLGIRLP